MRKRDESASTKSERRDRSAYAYIRHIWVIEVEWKRRKGKPVEPVAITTGAMLTALFLAKSIAEQKKIPQSWVTPVLYKRDEKGTVKA